MKTTRRTFLESAAAAAAMAALAGCAKKNDGATKQVAKGAGRKILILGGTGFLGPQLVEAALQRGHTLTLFNRGKTRPGLFPDVEKLRGDRDGKLDALKGRRWDAVIDTSGYVPRIVKMSADLLKDSVDHYLFVSSISVYDEPKAGSGEDAALMTMEDPANEEVRKHYGALKALSEGAAEASMPGRVTNIRPGLIVGPGDPTDRFTYWPVTIDRAGEQGTPVLAPGDGTDPVQFIDVRDLAAWMIGVVEKKTTGVFNAVGPEGRLAMSGLLDACKQGASSDAELVWVPASFLEKKEVSPWMEMPVWVPAPDNGFSQLSSAKAIAAGLAFRPVLETVEGTLAWWKTLPEERRAKLRAGISPERETELLAAWKAEGGKASTSAPKKG